MSWPEFPPATGIRHEWDDLPAAVRAAVEEMLGDAVVAANSQPGGFSPGVAARLRMDGGGRAFVKAVGLAFNPDAPAMHRREARISVMLPDAVPAPRLLGAIEVDDWVALAYEDVDGRQPAVPWVAAELARVLGAVDTLARVLTPSPIAVESLAEFHTFDGFSGLNRARGAGESVDGLDPWVARHLERLAATEAGWARATEGETLLHVDLRADNMLITPAGRVLVVDWPHAAIGAAWVDLLVMLPSVAMQGGPQPWDVFDDQPVARDADPLAVTAMVCALAGFFVTIRWLRRRVGWD